MQFQTVFPAFIAALSVKREAKEMMQQTGAARGEKMDTLLAAIMP